jgi:hypothetical protein
MATKKVNPFAKKSADKPADKAGAKADETTPMKGKKPVKGKAKPC